MQLCMHHASLTLLRVAEEALLRLADMHPTSMRPLSMSFQQQQQCYMPGMAKQICRPASICFRETKDAPVARRICCRPFTEDMTRFSSHHVMRPGGCQFWRAWPQGLPVVATSCLGVQTFAQHNVNALLADPQVKHNCQLAELAIGDDTELMYACSLWSGLF